MFNDSIVTSTYNGLKVKLEYNECFMLLNREGIIDIQLGKSINKWKLRIIFRRDPEIGLYTYNQIIEGNIITLTYTNWNGDGWIELTEPHYIADIDNRVRIFIKMRTTANVYQDFRTVQLTIWKVA